MKTFLILLLTWAVCPKSMGQAPVLGGNIIVTERGRFANDGIITQSSGLALDPDGVSFWTHNDQADPSTELYNFTPTTGNTNVVLNKTVTINAPNLDWEDLTKDDQNNIYIAQTGKNCNTLSGPDCPSRHIFKIHKMPFASLTDGATVTPTTYHYKYPLTGYEVSNCSPTDTVFANVEAAIWRNGAIYLFTKSIWSKNTNNCGGWNPSTHTYLFKVPLTAGSSETNPIIPTYLGKMQIEVDPADPTNLREITGAAISPDGSRVALSNYGRLFMLEGFTGDNFFAGTHTYYNFVSTTGASQPRAYEGIEFSDNNTLYMSLDQDNGRVVSFQVNRPLPLIYSNFTVSNEELCRVRVGLEVVSSRNVRSVMLQHSQNAVQFDSVATLPVESSKNLSYIHEVSQLPGSIRYYRLKITDYDGKTEFSAIKSVTTACHTGRFIVRPNPSPNKTITLVWEKPVHTLPVGSYEVVISSLQGHILARKLLTGSDEPSISFPMALAGSYVLVVRQGEQVLHRQRVVTH